MRQYHIKIDCTVSSSKKVFIVLGPLSMGTIMDGEVFFDSSNWSKSEEILFTCDTFSGSPKSSGIWNPFLLRLDPLDTVVDGGSDGVIEAVASVVANVLEVEGSDGVVEAVASVVANAFDVAFVNIPMHAH